MKHLLKLPDRLMAIAGYIEKGASVADIGTDHGLLPVYLAQNRLARSIIASDISASSLDSARRNAAKYNVSHLITFITAPGLSGIDSEKADTIVISGLGGETIAGILAEATWTSNYGGKLVLQPQSKTGDLCRWLRECNFSIRDAKLVRDNGRLYVIMLVKSGKSDSVLEPELELLTRLMYGRDPLFTEYLEDLIAITLRVLEEMKNSETPGYLDFALRLSVYVSLRDVNEKWQSDN